MANKLHDMHDWLDACRRCGMSRQEIEEFNRPCLTDEQLADRREWHKEADAAVEAFARAKRGFH